MRTVLHVVGARPNFMKIAPVMNALRGRKGIRQILINTGQHYDEAMAGSFFRELDLPDPDRDLEVGSASHAVQSGRIMIAFEPICLEYRPELVVVVGDVNSTMAATLVAVKLGMPVAHVEAGLRSRDRAMPEEINRIVTDQLADLLLTPSADADENLRAEGVPAERIHRVGNVMIDTLFRFLPLASFNRIASRWEIDDGNYVVLTLHRPSNVDRPVAFRRLLGLMKQIARSLPVVFPVHPRTRQHLSEQDLADMPSGLIITEPLGYLDFLSLMSHARIVVTDSGGIQEETTALGVPCLTVRETTERPITVTEGTNRVVGTDPERILAGFHEFLDHPPARRRPALWDGHAADRIADVIDTFLDGQ